MFRQRRSTTRARRLVALLLASLAVHMVLLIVLPGDGRWVEEVYARGIYPVLGPAVAFLPGLLPFSLALVLLLLLVLWTPGYLGLNLVRWRRHRLALGQALGRTLVAWACVAAVLFHAFYLFWGYNYLRPPLEKRLGIESADLSIERHRETARFVVKAAVAARVPVAPWNRDELDRLVDAAIDRAVHDLEGRPMPVVSPLKGDLHTGLLALQGTNGFISPVTLEAHVDFGLPPFRLAFAAAHEKAHLAGFARERDANFVAWYALTHADDPRLRYAGYFGVVGYFIDAGTRELAKPLEPDFEALAAYRGRTVSAGIEQGSRRIYGAYMKANRMHAGLRDYGEVSSLIESWLELKG